eukprot:6191232-Pleurochrysis_carterae.AAC.2
MAAVCFVGFSKPVASSRSTPGASPSRKGAMKASKQPRGIGTSFSSTSRRLVLCVGGRTRMRISALKGSRNQQSGIDEVATTG